MDRVATFFAERTPRRGLALVAFVALLIVFRKLLVLLAFFVAFERALSLSSGFLAERFKWKREWALAAVLVVSGLVLVLIGWLSAGRIAKVIVEARETLPLRIAALREHPLFLALQEHLPDTEKLVQSAERYGQDIALAAAGIGHVIAYAVIGLVLAVVYIVDEPQVRAFTAGLAPKSLPGTLARWLSHLADAVSLTVQLQLIVALCNAVLTLPVLLMIGVKHVPMLMLFIFLSGLIPVVGNLLAGTVLCVLAYQASGMLGVGIFAGLTFALHKVEAYFLNPRLTARHIALPGFVLILSLIAWEHLLGFAGLFLSFPFLYLVGKIREEFRADAAS